MHTHNHPCRAANKTLLIINQRNFGGNGFDFCAKAVPADGLATLGASAGTFTLAAAVMMTSGSGHGNKDFVIDLVPRARTDAFRGILHHAVITKGMHLKRSSAKWWPFSPGPHVNFEFKKKKSHLIKCIWKCRLQSSCHFFPASVCVLINDLDDAQNNPWNINLCCFALLCLFITIVPNFPVYYSVWAMNVTVQTATSVTESYVTVPLRKLCWIRVPLAFQ